MHWGIIEVIERESIFIVISSNVLIVTISLYFISIISSLWEYLQYHYNICCWCIGIVRNFWNFCICFWLVRLYILIVIVFWIGMDRAVKISTSNIHTHSCRKLQMLPIDILSRLVYMCYFCYRYFLVESDCISSCGCICNDGFISNYWLCCHNSQNPWFPEIWNIPCYRHYPQIQ